LVRPRRTTTAVAVSIALHLAVGYAVGGVSWSRAEHEPHPLRVVWINEWPRAIPETAVPRAEEIPGLPIEEPAPVHEAEASGPPEPESTSPRAAAPTPAETPDAEELGPPERARLLPPGIDWEQERKNAVEQMLATQAREEGRITFSTEELFEEPVAEPPNPRAHIFDSPQRGSSRSALTPGQGRSRFANRVASLCNALTGGGLGISLFGFGVGTICADAGSGADFFADVRPAYMESLPVCVETRDPLLMPEPSDEFPTVKCRLVPKDELE
jgi:hypothetical protein